MSPITNLPVAVGESVRPGPPGVLFQPAPRKHTRKRSAAIEGRAIEDRESAIVLKGTRVEVVNAWLAQIYVPVMGIV